ncbi:uncharacterized protein LOC124277813 [Haliotis rubra]|uniref:uncharacterized protein LOC124277813 n=1 Tax=Haliotis rubra TaxID=36100 RepID=UPI001EE5762B|nr:uncharacterized protein LOC124277813 [Haliotis rubra]
MRKPLPEIKYFGGDPFEFRKFIRQFRSKILANSDIADENMNYLEQFTCGEANKFVKGFGYLDAEVGYVAAMKELEERYGNEHTVVNAFGQRALDWPMIKADNPKGLTTFPSS